MGILPTRGMRSTMITKAKFLNAKIAGAGSTLLLLALGFALLHLNSRLSLSLRFASYDWAYDFSFFKPRSAPASEIVMVYLDEASHLDFQQPFNQPWDRAIHARLLDRLTADGARAAIFDIVFSDAGPNPETDRSFAEAIRRNGHVILAADYSANVLASDEHKRTREMTLTPPYPPFTEAAAGWGLAQLQPDEDFLVREHNHGPPDNDFVSLTWAAARMLHLPVAAADQERFRERWVNYYNSPANFVGMSYKLAFDKPPAYFRNKIVFIGGRPQTGGLRERKDQFRSPYTTWYTNPVFIPAMDVHATVLLNLIREDWLRKLSTASEWILILLAALFFGLGLMYFRPSAAVGVAALGAVGFTLLALLLFGLRGIWFPWMVIVAAQAPFGLLCAISFKSVEWYVVRRTLEQQREQAQERIQEQAALLDKAQDAIMVHDLDGRSTYWNPSAERLYGWTSAEATAKNVEALLYQRDGAKFAEARAATLSRGEWIGQLRQTTKTGKDILAESRWSRVCDKAGQPRSVLVINTDITERQKLEAQLLRGQRMESIGTLAGGIAHDLNNVLTPIIMGAQLIEMREEDPFKKKTLRTIAVSAQRGADMVKQVLAFARGQEGDKATLQLKHVIHELAKIARETFPKSITVKSHIAAHLPPIQGDATQLHQVLLNLAVNARDAMPDGGEITIEADTLTLDEVAARQMLGAKPALYVRLQVKDTGTGIPQEIIDRIFEPFFTTKEVGKGTGLGLSTTLSIIKSHEALLDVASVVGKGTTFTMLFPPSEVAASAAPVVIAPTAVRGNGQLVLVIDDEPLIREMLDTVLTAKGYRVLQAEDGSRGVALFKQHASEVGVVIIDMMMPVLDGTKAMQAMREIRDDARFIFISGVMQPGDRVPSLRSAQIEMLRKPFTGDKVLETVARSLESDLKRLAQAGHD